MNCYVVVEVLIYCLYLPTKLYSVGCFYQVFSVYFLPNEKVCRVY